MLGELLQLPLFEHSNSHQVGLPQYRCDLLATGHLHLKPDSDYRYNNNFRQEQACVLQVTLSGHGCFQSEADQVHELHAGDCFIVTLPSDSSYFIGAQPWEFLYIYYTGELAYHHTQHIIDQDGFCFSISKRPQLAKALSQLSHGMLAKQRNSRNISGLLFQCLMAAYPNIDPNSQLGGVQRAREFIDTHFHDAELSIQSIADQADLSRFHFSRLFKQQFEISPYLYLIQKRMATAKELISQHEITKQVDC